MLQTITNCGEQSIIVGQSFLLGEDLKLEKSTLEAEQEKCLNTMHKFMEKLVFLTNQYFSSQNKSFCIFCMLL